jgi:hypothetical protein
MTVINFQDGGYASPEIVHFYSDELLVVSTHRRVVVQRKDDSRTVITLPRTKFDALGFSRLARRALRLDKCNVFPVDPNGQSLILIRQGAAYKYDDRRGLRQTLALRQSRNVLHTDFCKTKSGRIFFGEYGANTDRQPIPIYVSDDDGNTWQIAYQIPAGKAKHVHSVYADKYSNKIWIFTGDADGECWVIEANEDFSEVRYLGDGSQIYRACTTFFTPDKVVWAMDSPLEPSQTVHFDRMTGSVEFHGSFPGPIWYGLEVPPTGYLLASTVEPGESVTGYEAGIYFSENLVTWSRSAAFTKDHWPMGLFKFGVIGFSRGERSDGSFFVFGEALKGLDGRSLRCKIKR